MPQGSIFTQTLSYTNTLLVLELTGLLLLAAFFGPLVVCTSSLGLSWCQWQPAVSCLFLWSLVVLDNDLWCSFAASCIRITRPIIPLHLPNQFCVKCILSRLPLPPTTMHIMIRLAWYCWAKVNVGKKKYSKWWELCCWSIKGKRLVYGTAQAQHRTHARVSICSC